MDNEHGGNMGRQGGRREKVWRGGGQMGASSVDQNWVSGVVANERKHSLDIKVQTTQQHDQVLRF